MNYIIRAVYNRPEMFYVSLKTEEIARQHYCNDDFTTLFCIEYGAPTIIKEIIEKVYPYKYEIVNRSTRHFGWGNILEGFNQALQHADKYMLNLEDDCVVHETYFEYIDKVLPLIDNKCAVVNGSNRSTPNRDQSLVNVVNKTSLFEATCCMMFVDFYKEFVKPYATYDYYRNRQKIIDEVNKRNGDDPRSKFRPSRNNLNKHIGWDGLVNRLVDTARIEKDMYCVSPQTDRRIHIGFYGQNRPGRFPSEETDFFKRVDLLVNIVNNPETMAKLDGRYKDYSNFDPSLEDWSGTLIMED
jgi:hypothetical protein